MEVHKDTFDMFFDFLLNLERSCSLGQRFQPANTLWFSKFMDTLDVTSLILLLCVVMHEYQLKGVKGSAVEGGAKKIQHSFLLHVLPSLVVLHFELGSLEAITYMIRWISQR